MKVWAVKAMLLSLVFNVQESFAARAWLGEVPVTEIFYAKANGNCGASGAPCLMLKFGKGFRGCEQIAISESDHHYKEIQTLALVSMTASRSLSIYASDEYCLKPDLININNVILR